MMRITDRQIKTLHRLGRAENNQAPINPDLARQLIAKGLVIKVRTYTRYEWNTPVATLWVVRLTEAGMQEGTKHVHGNKP